MKNEHRHKPLIIGSYITIAMAIGVMLYGLYTMLWPIKIIDRVSPAEVLTPVVYRGGVMSYILDYCKYRDYQSEVFYSLSDGNIYSLDIVSPRLRLGCYRKTLNVKIPMEVEPGMYTFNVDVYYRVNVLRTEPYHFTTERFEVK